MSVSIKYKGTEIASASTETTKTIKTAGKYCEADILVENTPDGGDAPVINPLSVTENGTYTAPSGIDGYSPVTVNVPQGITPTGNINITDTNVTDVTNYATAQVVDADLVASNIKEGVNILGILGTFAGGGLPSSISKIDGGSFTPASDTDVRGYFISHNLGVAPKGYRIWCPEMFNDLSDQTQPSLLFLFVICNIDLRWGSKIVSGYCNGMTRNKTGGGVGQPNTDINMQWFSESYIGIPTNASQYYYYLAGKTYKWVAWA